MAFHNKDSVISRLERLEAEVFPAKKPPTKALLPISSRTDQNVLAAQVPETQSSLTETIFED